MDELTRVCAGILVESMARAAGARVLDISDVTGYDRRVREAADSLRPLVSEVVADHGAGIDDLRQFRLDVLDALLTAPRRRTGR